MTRGHPAARKPSRAAYADPVFVTERTAMPDYGHELELGAFLTPQSRRPQATEARAQFGERSDLDCAGQGGGVIMAEAAARRPPEHSSIRNAMETIHSTRGRARQFWRVFDTSLVPMVIVDNERRHVAANAAARLAFRLSLNEFLSRSIDDLTPPQLVARMHESWERLMRDGTVSGPYSVRFPDGSHLAIVYCALANALPALHLLVFAPANWPGDELDVAPEPATQRSRRPLSPREREVLSLIATGAEIEQIADELTISVATARTHTRNALRKLAAHNRAHAIAVAMRDDLLDLPD